MGQASYLREHTGRAGSIFGYLQLWESGKVNAMNTDAGSLLLTLVRFREDDFSIRMPVDRPGVGAWPASHGGPVELLRQ